MNALQESTADVYPSPSVRTVPWHEGDVIRKLRVAAGLRLEDLAAMTTLSFTTIAALEIGKTREAKRTTIEKIALAFGLTERELRDMVPRQGVRLAQAEPQKLARDKRKRQSATLKGAIQR